MERLPNESIASAIKDVRAILQARDPKAMVHLRGLTGEIDTTSDAGERVARRA